MGWKVAKKGLWWSRVRAPPGKPSYRNSERRDCYGTVAQMPELPTVHSQGRSTRGRRPATPNHGPGFWRVRIRSGPAFKNGAVAQTGERRIRIAKVGSSILPGSTKFELG